MEQNQTLNAANAHVDGAVLLESGTWLGMMINYLITISAPPRLGRRTSGYSYLLGVLCVLGATRSLHV